MMDKSVWMATAFLLGSGTLAVAMGLLYSQGSADLSGADAQPLRFSHELHAGRLQIDCLYCHRFAERSTAAGVPSMQLCMGCHQNLANGSQETRVLLERWREQTAVSWVRLQRLPDFVYFTHERHLAHDLQCATCHGQVEQMPYTPRAATYEMGWCLSCHRDNVASRDCLVCHK
ncbi:MAG: cytochrome c3 family protein [Nitrospiraceae bacterium]